MKIESVSIEKLIKDPVNARKHNEKNIEAIKGSLAKFGQQKPIVVNKDNVVVAGNGTLEAARQLGWKEINVVRTELTGTDITAFGLADNRTSELAEWDLDVLPELLTSLQELDFDLSSIGFDEDDLNKLIPEEIEPGLTDDDAIPENVETRCKLGDLWLLGNHRLLCGDSTNIQHVERLMNGEKADMVFTDPPYGMNLDTDYSSMVDKKGYKGKKFKPVIGDDGKFDPNIILGFFDYCNEIFLFGADYYAERLHKKNDGSWIVWDKRSKGDEHIGMHDNCFGSDFELCWSKNRHQRKIARILRQRGAFLRNGHEDLNVHPTQKPVDLAVWFFDHWGKPNDLVADLFLGSGSTIIACEKTGRKCYGMEIDPYYCDVIISRWEQFTGKQAVLSIEESATL